MREAPSALPTVSVVICTINRSSLLTEAVASVLASQYPAFSVIVVDQSPKWEGESVLATFASDPRFTYLHSVRTGEAHARNLALRAGSSDLVLCTDDDCVVATDWVAFHVAAFSEYPDAAVVFGPVRPPRSHRRDDGFVPTFRADPPWLGRRGSQPVILGMSANMSFRRSVLDRIGYFDEALGAGGSLAAAEDFDFSLRATAAGLGVITDPRPVVYHEGGVRPRGNASTSLWYRDGYGMGALMAKSAKAANWSGAVTVARKLLAQPCGAARAAMTGRRPTGLRRALSATRGGAAGFAAGLARPLERRDNGWVFGDAPGARRRHTI